MALAFLLYALFASVFTVAKGALAYSAPFFLVGSRMMIAGGLMLGYAGLRFPQALRLSWPGYVRVVLLGIFNIYLTNVLEFWGLQYLTSFKTCFIYSLSPFLSALFSYFLLRDVLSFKKWMGLLIGFAGFTPILLQHGSQELISGFFGSLSWAEISVIGAVIFSVIGWILLSQLVQTERCPPIVANGYSMLLGGTLALIHSFSTESWNPIPVTDVTIWLESTLFLIVVSNIVCYNLYGHLLKKFSPTFMAFAGLSTPISTAIFGWIFHGEIVSIWFFISLVIVFFGLLIFYYEELRSPKTSLVR
jgi:drug/metabolite transporter (DMT)-like permease